MPRDMAEVVGSAKAEMDRLIQLGRLQGDPLRHPIEAMGVVLDVLVDVVNEVRDARRPQPTLTDQQAAAVGRGFAMAGQVEVARMVRNEFRRVLAWLLAALVAALVVGFGAGWLTGHTGPTVLGEQQCQTQADGSRLCWVPVVHRN